MEFITFSEIAKATGVTTQTVHSWHKLGQLPTVFKFGNKYRISLHDFEQWLGAQQIDLSKSQGVSDVK